MRRLTSGLAKSFLKVHHLEPSLSISFRDYAKRMNRFTCGTPIPDDHWSNERTRPAKLRTPQDNHMRYESLARYMAARRLKGSCSPTQPDSIRAAKEGDWYWIGLATASMI